MNNISFEIIEEKIINYILENGKKLRFILMDSETFKKFNDYSRPIEREIAQSQQENMNVKKIYTFDALVEFLSIETAENVFEVVG